MDSFDIFSVLHLIGGLAVFLFGMNVMGDALERSAGNKLKSILEGLTSNKYKGILLGIVVTAIIQSSSATTVMVVGFVNSGIMKLGQSIGIIMGANIGTTVTAWLLSLSGIEGDNIFINLLKPSSFTPVLAIIGIALHTFSKSSRKRDVGSVMLGFAVLIMGMDSMSAAVKPLANVPQFQNILIMFQNPLLGILTGTIVTGIIQSSSASVGILQALSVTGAITYNNAIPIIMGQNIGTTITALLSSVGANKNAKRAAIVHLFFNILGTLSFTVVFYVLKAIFPMDFLGNTIGAAEIAIVHTAFNLFTTIIMIPLTGLLEKIAYIVVRDDNTKEVVPLIDERLLSTPAVALGQVQRIATDMATLSKESVVKSIELLSGYTRDLADQVRGMEELVDKYEDVIGSYLVKLSRETLSDDNSHECAKILHTIGDLERISDHATNIMGVAEELYEKKTSFSEDTERDLGVLSEAVKELLGMSIDAFVNSDIALAKRIEPLEERIDRLTAKIRKRYITKIQRSEYNMQTGFILSDLLTNYERIGDHCSNIAVCIIELDNDSYETHEYLNKIKSEQDKEFAEFYEAYKAKYHI